MMMQHMDNDDEVHLPLDPEAPAFERQVNLPNLHTYIHTYLSTYPPTHLTYIPTDLSTYLRRAMRSMDQVTVVWSIPIRPNARKSRNTCVGG